MDKKLTLSLNQKVIEKAKDYAKSNDTSLSRLFEAFLVSLITKEGEDSEVSPLVKSLSGVVELPKDFEDRKRISKRLDEKYQ